MPHSHKVPTHIGQGEQVGHGVPSSAAAVTHSADNACATRRWKGHHSSTAERLGGTLEWHQASTICAKQVEAEHADYRLRPSARGHVTCRVSSRVHTYPPSLPSMQHSSLVMLLPQSSLQLQSSMGVFTDSCLQAPSLCPCMVTPAGLRGSLQCTV